MKRIFTMCLVVAMALSESFAQDYADLQSTSSDYGTLSALTSLADSVTSNGRRGGSKNYSGRQALTYEGKYYFMASNDASGDELWVTDGTREGTMMIKDINAGSEGSLPANLIGVGGSVYFTATTVAEGTEIWVTDGTETGTTLLIDLFEGADSSEPNTLTPFKDGFLFAAVDANSANYGDDKTRQQLWYSNGTPEGTIKMSADNKDGVQPKTTGMDAEEWYSHIQVIGDTLAIFGGTSDRVVGQDGDTDLIIGQEIWVTNGTPEPWGTRLLVDINPPTDNSNIQWLYTVNDKQVIFRSKTPGKWNGQDDFTTLDNEYWVTDGSTKGTYLLQDLNNLPGSITNTTSNSGSANPRVFDGKVYYRGSNGEGTELMRMNSLSGDGSSLEQAYDIAPFDTQGRSSFVDDLFPFDGKLFFKVNFASTSAVNYPKAAQELGLFDPVTDEVQMVADIYPGTGTSSFPRNKTVVNGRMYFTANTGGSQSSYDIWALDVVGDGSDPDVPELDNLSNLSEYLVYKVFDDADGFNAVAQRDLQELNGNLIFRTISGSLAIFDDGLTKSTEPYVDAKDQGPDVEIGANAYLNAAPIVSITSPANGVTLVEGATIEIAVDLVDPEDDAIAKVEYYTGDYFNTWELIGTATTGDFSLSWENIPAGVEGEPTRITAIAYDASDSLFSMPIDVLVVGNTPPVVDMVLPNDNTTIEIGSTVEVSATASDELDGLIVEFYSGDDLIFTDDTEPFGFEWDGLTEEGTAVIKAVAIDVQGASSESETRTVIFEEPLSITFTKSVNVYPNPTINGFFNVSNVSEEKLQIMLVDMTGKTVLKENISQGVTEISVNNLETGIYSISTQSSKGIVLGSSKLIIK